MTRPADTAVRLDHRQRPTAETVRQNARLRLALMRAAVAERRDRKEGEKRRPDSLRDFWKQT